MAELTYDEVKRAAHDATRPFQDMLAIVRSHQDDMRRSIQQLDNLTFRVNSMQSQLNVMQQQLNDHSNTMRPVQGTTQQHMQVLQNQQADMMRKVSEVEQLLRSCLQYLGSMRQ